MIKTTIISGGLQLLTKLNNQTAEQTVELNLHVESESHCSLKSLQDNVKANVSYCIT